MTKKTVYITESQIQKLAEEIVEEFVINETQQKAILTEMARFSKETSKLPMAVWFDPNDGTNTGQHNLPRLKFQDNTSDRLNPSHLVPMSIDPKNPIILVKNYRTNLPSKDIKKLKQWIVQNYGILLKYWNGEIYEDVLMRDVKPYVKANDLDEKNSGDFFNRNNEE